MSNLIKAEKIVVFGFEAAIRGMRNPMNSWDKSDSFVLACEDGSLSNLQIGKNDLKLMQSLVKAGTDHSKFMRMINVTMDITAPMYFNKELDTYKIGTVRNSCSTMHKIHTKEFTLDDFSHEHLTSRAKDKLEDLINELNHYRNLYLNGGNDYWTDSDDKDYEPKDKKIWWQMIQLLPSSYNQRFTWQANYQVLRNIYFSRKNHKLDEWIKLCDIIKQLPYAKELICLE